MVTISKAGKQKNGGNMKYVIFVPIDWQDNIRRELKKEVLIPEDQEDISGTKVEVSFKVLGHKKPVPRNPIQSAPKETPKEPEQKPDQKDNKNNADQNVTQKEQPELEKKESELKKSAASPAEPDITQHGFCRTAEMEFITQYKNSPDAQKPILKTKAEQQFGKIRVEYLVKGI